MREYLSERDYAARMQKEVEPQLRACRSDGSFAGAGGVKLCYSVYAAPEPHGSVVLVHGFTESAEKYREMIFYFLREGFTVCAYDQRGHGHSPRTAPPEVTHVDDFEEYVEDLAALVAGVGQQLPSPRVLFCHSMGGAVGALYLIRQPGYFDRAILSSPMLAAKHGALALPLCRALCLLFMALGRGKRRIFVTKPQPALWEETLEGSSSDCAARFEYYRALRGADPLLCGGKPSYGWTYTALGVTKRILRRGAPEGIRIPILLFSSEQDALVKHGAQERFISRVPHGELVRVPTRHEIYASSDQTLFPYLERVLDFASGK